MDGRLFNNEQKGKKSSGIGMKYDVFAPDPYLVLNGDESTPTIIKISMQCMRGGSVVRGFLRNLSDVLYHAAMGFFAILQEDICTALFGCDIVSNVTAAFVMSGYVEGGNLSLLLNYVGERDFYQQ